MRLTPESLAELRPQHAPTDYLSPLYGSMQICAQCDVEWPCNTSALLGMLAEKDAEIERLRGVIAALEARCPESWCAYPMPHTHAQGSGDTNAPTFDDLLNDPTQQLDQEGVVARSVFYESPTLTTAEREWLSDALLNGYDHIVSVVEQIVASRAAIVKAARAAAPTEAAKAERAAATEPTTKEG